MCSYFRSGKFDNGEFKANDRDNDLGLQPEIAIWQDRKYLYL